jgi:monoamine oxidase
MNNKEFEQSQYDVIVVGAGIAGLSAALDLRKQSKAVMIIEARERTGGRIHSAREGNFSKPVEAGAEFVHGNAPMLHKLFESAGIPLVKTESNAWEIERGKLKPSDIVTPDIEMLSNALQKLKVDITMSEFLNTNFPGSGFGSLRENVKYMVQGFDAADVTKISALSLRDEWSDDESFSGKRPMEGYSQLIDSLTEEARETGVELLLNSPVKEIRWKPGKAEVFSRLGQFQAQKILVTAPASVLKSGAIKFVPALTNHNRALQQIETGGVIKFLFEFKEALWEKPGSGFRHMRNLGFVFSDAPIPTWWTQLPSPFPLMTGWLAGPFTARSREIDELMTSALESLAYIFDCPVDTIKSKLVASRIVNWVDDKFSMGAYAYKTPQTGDALKIITEPADKTIFFAGEAFSTGKEMGTVEAALISAHAAVQKIRATAN